MALEALEPRTLLAATFAPSQVVIQFNPGVTEGARAAVLGVVSGTVRERIHTPSMVASGAGELDVVNLPRGLAVNTAITRLRNNPSIAFAEPNWVFTAQATSNDPYYTSGNLWGMYGDATSPTNQFGSQAGEVWASGNVGSSSVVVGIIDEGIDYNHPDLAANIWTNPGEVVGNGVDDDGNGYIDDIHGWDFSNNDNSIFDGTTSDSVDRHGTHVAGTIGGVGGNGQGVAGVAWNVTMISAKFLGPTGGYLSDAVEALDYLTNLKTRYGVNVVASNNSWGGGGFSSSLQSAITRAANAGILFVAAAGNDGVNNDSTASYPSNYNTTAGAGYDNVIAVAAIDRSGNLASFSNYGATTVDLGAPGVSINSTLPFNTYGSYSGTSMATPHVTGAAALYAASHPGATANAIRTALLNSALATPTASLAGKTVTGGRLNVSAMPDVQPSLSINNVALNEGANGTTSFTFTVSLSSPSTGTVTVGYSTADGTAATASGDYQAGSGTLTFAAGVTSQTITVSVNGDTVAEPNETFFVNLASASNATIADGQGLGTIVDDDTALPSLSINSVSKSEGNRSQTKFTFTVSLSAASTQTVNVQYATQDGSALAGSDYKAVSGTLSFSPGVTSRTITITVYTDRTFEANESFFLNLSNAGLAVAQGIGTILNDDAAPAGQAANSAAIRRRELQLM
ncbi:hypothetical protein LBMAG52_45460 [Planctomycetia bacterium]|nr:hypothetical protein LBMAG52_45460 [Planctomycetia bacterium]